MEGGSWADQGYESELIPVDLARRVLAEMDEVKDEAQRWKERWQEAVRHADEAFAERDAAQATLAEARAVHAPVNGCGKPAHTVPTSTCPECTDYCAACDEAMPCDTIRILDRSTP